MKKLLIALAAVSLAGGTYFLSRTNATALVAEEKPAEIKWYSLEEAQKLSDANPRLIFLDLSTSWCGWCKTMDRNTFANPTIAKYMNEHYYCVRFDAETRDTVYFNGQKFINQGPAGQRSAHDFAIAVLQGRLSYPSFAFFSKDRKNVTIMQGYMEPARFEPYLHFYGEEKNLTMSWEEFLKQFKSELPADNTQPAQVPAPH